MKRLLDVVLCLIALAILVPLFMVVSTAIWLDSGFPILFYQTRVGKDERRFVMLKFRSMVKDAPATGPFFTRANDARITRVGRFIRRTSIDELPQIFNVLIGDMSLVGPRPDVPVQKTLYKEDDWARRCSVRPGITGLAQVRGRSETTQEERLSLDLHYIENMSHWEDIKIMWWTLGQLDGRQAN